MESVCMFSLVYPLMVYMYVCQDAHTLNAHRYSYLQWYLGYRHHKAHTLTFLLLVV